MIGVGSLIFLYPWGGFRGLGSSGRPSGKSRLEAFGIYPRGFPLRVSVAGRSRLEGTKTGFTIKVPVEMTPIYEEKANRNLPGARQLTPEDGGEKPIRARAPSQIIFLHREGREVKFHQKRCTGEQGGLV